MIRSIAILVPLTGEARVVLSGASELILTRFPFRVGRESRSPAEARVDFQNERRRSTIAPNNDLYIWDPGPLLNVSREHFQIERGQSGEFFLRDRGSTCGTVVADVRLGAGGPESCVLYPDNTIVVGTPQSPFVFRFDIQEEKRVAPVNDPLESTSAREKAQITWNLRPAHSRER